MSTTAASLTPSSRLKHSAQWLYHESGIESLYVTGRDAWLVVLARSCRMFAFGAVSLIIALFFAELQFSDFQIGLFMTIVMIGDVVLSLALTLIADALGRRRILLAGGVLMAASGLVFVFFENFWILLLAAVIGVISATGSDFGPFRAIEESTLSHLTSPKTRADVLTWYVTCSGLGSAAGVELSGRIVEALHGRDGWDLLRTYHATFWIYVFMGVTNVMLTLSMSKNCEIADPVPEETDPGVEAARGLLEEEEEEEDEGQDTTYKVDVQTPTANASEAKKKKKSLFAQISSATRSIMFKLWFLLAVDSLADGMVSYTLTNYYLDGKFHLAKSTLGDIMSTAFILGTVGTIFAGPLSRHLGLINTMVFTHLPSSAAVLFFPLPPSLVPTMLLLFVRTGLNSLDQAPRTAFIAAVVKPEERTAVMGITSMLRTLAATVGPTVTGGLAQSNKFWIAFVVAGALRIAYDLGLWAMFVNMKLHTHEDTDEPNEGDGRRVSDEEEAVELQPVARPSGSE